MYISTQFKNILKDFYTDNDVDVEKLIISYEREFNEDFSDSDELKNLIENL